MKSSFLVFSSFFIMFFIFSCKKTTQGPNDVLPEQKDTFENMFVDISANVNNVVLDSVIVIETSCIPKFNGKGTISLLGDGMIDSAMYLIRFPVQDTVIRQKEGTSNTSIPVSFTANDTFKINWKIILKTPISYSFSAKAIFDSIFVADSTDLFNFDYDYLKKQGYKYKQMYANSFSLVITYP